MMMESSEKDTANILYETPSERVISRQHSDPLKALYA
jgi:hypothetical protein